MLYFEDPKLDDRASKLDDVAKEVFQACFSEKSKLEYKLYALETAEKLQDMQNKLKGSINAT